MAFGNECATVAVGIQFSTTIYRCMADDVANCGGDDHCMAHNGVQFEHERLGLAVKWCSKWIFMVCRASAATTILLGSTRPLGDKCGGPSSIGFRLG